MTAPTPAGAPEGSAAPPSEAFVPQQARPAEQYGASARVTPPATAGTLAEWGPRAVGLLLDSAVGLAIYLGGFVVAGIVGTVSAALALLVMLATLAVYLGWFVVNLVEQGQTGQSLGKRVVGLKLVRADDGQLTGAGLSVGRGFAHCLEFGIGWLFPLFDDKKQTFADKICATVVVTAPKADWRPALLRPLLDRARQD